MAGYLGYLPKDYLPLTLRELIIAHDGKLLAEWDHTAALTAQVYNLTILVASFGGKCKAKPRGPLDFHPFREKPVKGLILTKKNFSVLKEISIAYAQQT